MSKYILPPGNKWTQLNQGDLLGSLFSTYNIDLGTPSVLRLAQRTKYLGHEATSGSSFDNLLSVVYGNFGTVSTVFQYWLVTSDKIYTVNSDLSGFAIDSLANTPSLHPGSDAVTWNGDLYVTKTARISKLSAGTWTASFSTSDFTNVDSGFPHPIAVNVTNENLLVGDGNVLKKVVGDGTVSTAITLPSNYRIEWIRPGRGINYIGCRAVTGGYTEVFDWDGRATTAQANNRYPLDSTWALSGVIDPSGVLYIITKEGKLQIFNGVGFTTVAQLPFVNQNLGYLTSNSETLSAINRNGMAVISGNIYINIKSNLVGTNTLVPQFLSGVWVYDNGNFYHKYGLSTHSTANDFGQPYFPGAPFAIAPFYADEIGGSITNPAGTVFLTGARLNGGDGSDYYTLVSVSTGENRGTFVTPRIESSEITDNYISLWCKFNHVLTSSDKIIFKYRTSKRQDIPFMSGVITWTSNTQFTTTNSASEAAKFALVRVGDEVTILRGDGAGSTAHITNLSANGNIYTVTLDEAITNVTTNDTSYVIVDNWTKINQQITNADTTGFKRLSVCPKTGSPWIQIKGELRGEGVEIQKLVLNTETNTLIN